MTEFLLWTTLPVCLIGILVLLVKRSYPVATLLLGGGLFAFAGLSFVDLKTLNDPAGLMNWRQAALLFECCATFLFYFYTKTIYRDNSEIYKGPGFWISVVLSVITLIFVAIYPADQMFFSPDFAEEKLLYLGTAGFFVYLLLMFYLVFGLVQLERTLAGLHRLQRWGVKLEVVASGLLLATLALYYSNSLLYRSIDMNYLGLRNLVVVVAIALLCYSRLFRESRSHLSLSRGIAHRSFVLLIVGGYLIILGVLGEGLRYLNLENTRPVLYFLMLVGSVGLAVLFLSERLRRKFRVTLHKNFYQSKYDYREQWEKFSLQTGEAKTLAEVQTAVLDLFCETLACKWATLYLLDPDSNDYIFSAAFNAPRDWRPFTSSDPLIAKMQHSSYVVNLNEENPELTESLLSGLKAGPLLAVVPMLFDEELAGFVILGEQIDTGEELDYQDYDLLKMLAHQSISQIQGMRLTEQLSNARELAAIGKVSTFVLHDLKNQVSGLSLMLDNAREYIEDPEFQQDMLETVQNTVDNMKALIARLKNLKEKPELIIAPVDLKKVVMDAINTSGGKIDVSGASVIVDADEEEIYRVVLNLLMNALEATGTEEAVTVCYGEQDGQAVITVADEGDGMSADFIRDQLFQPFHTTKKHGFGIGLYQCKQIIESHRGNISVESKEGEGTKFTIQLPLAPAIVDD